MGHELVYVALAANRRAHDVQFRTRDVRLLERSNGAVVALVRNSRAEVAEHQKDHAVSAEPESPTCRSAIRRDIGREERAVANNCLQAPTAGRKAAVEIRSLPLAVEDQ